MGGRDAQTPPGDGLLQWGCSVSWRLKLRPPPGLEGPGDGRVLSTPCDLSIAPQPRPTPSGEFEVLSGEASCLVPQSRVRPGGAGAEHAAPALVSPRLQGLPRLRSVLVLGCFLPLASLSQGSLSCHRKSQRMGSGETVFPPLNLLLGRPQTQTWEEPPCCKDSRRSLLSSPWAPVLSVPGESYFLTPPK